ncbi:hypothetical protein [Hymenobacter sp. HDW8]|uniref:hypothetical protein n=1 Tax=Hymenobacter sp. HDW8 TaxID=2714932 RepID=UPI00140A3DFA|nr:hypothetical protein [Hymenobacter sp. HDW8]QIL76609.1 hypothetical protein G7064_12625 [Hymenobacter sp. HDW8]
MVCQLLPAVLKPKHGHAHHAGNCAVCPVQTAVGLPDGILYYIDGQRVNKEDLDKISPNDIASMNVLKGPKVRAVLGNVSETQAILITTKANENSAAVVALNKKLNSSADIAGKLLLIDGKEVTRTEFERMVPSQIYQITVLSPEKAVEAYGEKGKNGAAIITTK